MSDSQVCVRPVDGADLAAVAAIHRHYVENTLVCVPETERTMAQWKEFADNLRTRRLPFLVALDAEVVGYACVYPWKPGPSYRYAGEVSAYLAPGRTGRRIGDALMRPLIEASRKAGLRQLIGAVAQTTAAPHTAAYAHRYGFEECGLLRSMAYRQGQWLDFRLYQCQLVDPLPVDN
ncbi:N-acetyltransferase family protein [Streptomyces sp. NPDC023327]|uniref:GNAT family N-acetyltransferase n=1 Tax=Streptomyces sp. NPDC023327 TaxID=3157088 RepID=UPI0033D17C53